MIKNISYLLILVIYLTYFASPAIAGFSCNNTSLTATTSKLELKFEAGLITYLKDLTTNHVFVDTGSGYLNQPTAHDSYIGFISRATNGNYEKRWPTESTLTTCGTNGSDQATIQYTNLGGSWTGAGSSLTYNFAIVPSTGEVTIKMTGQEPMSDRTPFTLDLSLTTTSTSIILGNGNKYTTNDPANLDFTKNTGRGLNAPSVAILESSQSAIGIFSSDFHGVDDEIKLNHSGSTNTVTLHNTPPTQANPLNITSSTWHIGAFNNWVAVSKRWHQVFESKTQAKPLWENRAPWVRNIHAVHGADVNSYDNVASRYQELASLADPQKTLYFLWNGDKFILFGDNTLAQNGGRPSPAEQTYLKQYGWPVLLYHPYTLIPNRENIPAKYDWLRSLNWLPTNYQYQPVYQGAKNEAAFYQHFDGLWGLYSTDLYTLHTGAQKVRDYMVLNALDYFTKYNAKGAYFDVLGNNEESHFNTNQKIIEGNNFLQGETLFLKQLATAKSDVGIMSEYQTISSLPYTFFSWEGVNTHTVQEKNGIIFKYNHPLRTALIGRYGWTYESYYHNTDMDYRKAAYLGTLPELPLASDYQIPQEIALWTQKRAKLFTELDLFNDVPTNWNSQALAYYRTNRGTWVKFMDVGTTYGYVEEFPDGNNQALLMRDGSLPTIPRLTSSFNPPPGGTTPSIPGDLTGDGKVNLSDFNRLISFFGNPYTLQDYNALIANFGKY